MIDKRREAKKQKNVKGFDRTPAFIHAVVKDAVQHVSSGKVASDLDDEDTERQNIDPDASTLPKGGFTDVGLHTGGIQRDTAWRLVKETLLVSNPDWNSQTQFCLYWLLVTVLPSPVSLEV